MPYFKYGGAGPVARGLSRQEKFRLGMFGPTGQNTNQTFILAEKTIRTIAVNILNNNAATEGFNAIFDLTNWDAAAEPLVFDGVASAGAPVRHPTEHIEAVAAGFTRSLVLSSQYVFDITFRAANTSTKDYVVCYAFSRTNTPIPDFTATSQTTAQTAWMNIQGTRAWVWRRFSGTADGGKGMNSGGTIKINIPDVPKLTMAANTNQADDISWQDCTCQLDDTSANRSTITYQLHFVILTTNGVAFAANDINIGVRVYQTIRVYRETNSAEMEHNPGIVGA